METSEETIYFMKERWISMKKLKALILGACVLAIGLWPSATVNAAEARYQACIYCGGRIATKTIDEPQPATKEECTLATHHNCTVTYTAVVHYEQEVCVDCGSVYRMSLTGVTMNTEHSHPY